MNIESLEINVLKASEIKDGDVIIVKIKESDKIKFSKESVTSLYKQIKDMIKKDNIPIYFFPQEIDIEILKNHVQEIEKNKEKIEETTNNENYNNIANS
jgi:2-C-methyl-D-erythritol 4-phosphate cytidylyltransferase